MTKHLIMDGELNKKTLWDSAGKGGLILGGITVGFVLLAYLLTLLPETPAFVFLNTVMGFIIWAAKLFVCIYVMYRLMKKFAIDFPSADKVAVRRYGTLVGVTSALIVAAFTLIELLYIAPDTFSEGLETVLSQYSSMLDSNSMEALENMTDKMPVISFFSTFIYCSLFGLIVSAIFAGKVKPDNPFIEE